MPREYYTVFGVVILTTGNPFKPFILTGLIKVLEYQLISIGGITDTVVDVRCIYLAALKTSASSILLTHNHPLGNNEPSNADIKITKKLKDAGQLLDISLPDHLILLPERYTSLTDEKLI